MTKKSLTPAEFLEIVRPMITKIDDSLYAHNFGEVQFREQIEALACDSEAITQWVESLDFRLSQARLTACDTWNLALCDLTDELQAIVADEPAAAKPKPTPAPSPAPGKVKSATKKTKPN